MITFTEIESALVVFVAIFAVIATVWGGIRSIREAISPLTNLISEHHDVAATVKTIDGDVAKIKDKMNDYDEYFRKDKRQLEKDREDLDSLKKANALVLQGINQLIEHELNGGKNAAELKETHESINKYLINRV